TSAKLLHTFEGHKAEISAVEISPDGRWAATASTDRTVRLWDLKEKKAGPVLKGHTAPVNAVAFSDDGATVFAASVDGTIRSWRRTDGEFQRILYKHGFGINVMIALRGKNKLVFGSLNGHAGIVDTASGEQVHRFEPIEGPVLALALQDKPGLMAISGHQLQGRSVVGNIRVFRRGDWALIETYDDPRGPVWAMDFGTDGATLYYGGKDDFVTAWQVRPRKPFEQVSGPGLRRFEVSENLPPGEAQFARKCSLCHTLRPDGRNRAGPTLYKLFGRKAGTLPGYPYSDALLNADIVWSEETIGKLFGLGPDHYTPGTKMPLQKISDPEKRKALIAYLKVATSDETGSDSANKASNDAGKTDSREK
ncbi:MAG: cytochrome C, partial [Hyphomicrobiales bacterium]|nr:cytochrome C [Hyphomicrobiales bacterium]